MTDEEFFEKFENATLSPKLFHHREHVKMAWLYLKKDELPAALAKFSASLKRFSSANGADNLYHETITFAFMAIINERLRASPDARGWEAFVEENPDIFDWKENVLKKYYREETLKSDFARRNFVFPDKFKNVRP